MIFYLFGILARLQTIMIGYFLFYVEYENICVVADQEFQPIPMELLPVNLDYLPGDFAVVSYVF